MEGKLKLNQIQIDILPSEQDGSSYFDNLLDDNVGSRSILGEFLRRTTVGDGGRRTGLAARVILTGFFPHIIYSTNMIQ